MKDLLNEEEERIALPSLKSLLKDFEDANSHPSEALQVLGSTANTISRCVQRGLTEVEIEERFAPGQSSDEIQEDIESFMQNAILLIDNHFDL